VGTPPHRRSMVRRQLLGRGLRDRTVIRAFLRVDREEFVPDRWRADAHADSPVPIGLGQTISQPYMVAVMLERLCVRRGMSVLEVGSGSGYVLALLHAMGAVPHGVEMEAELVRRARGSLAALGLDTVPIRIGDGGEGWPERGPYDRILVSAACPEVPPPLLVQLAPGGRLLAPVGARRAQLLETVQKRGDAMDRERGCGCVFVPLRGAHGY